MPRVLLLLPTTSYRTADFMEAADRMGVGVVVGSDLPQVLEAHAPGGTLTLDFGDPDRAAREIALFARRFPLDAVISADDDTVLTGTRAAETLGLPCNLFTAVLATRDKHRFRLALREAGVSSPGFETYSVNEDPLELAAGVEFPCVLKPLFLSASRGVIRADDAEGFVEAFLRVKKILEDPEVAAKGREAATRILVERFIPGFEVALEGILREGALKVLALFDKPDPLDGPYFEETLYVTPSRLPPETRRAVAETAARSARAVGLREGPIHAELRVNPQGVWPIEIAARSIGGLCGRALRFGAGLSLEEVILRHALGLDFATLERDRRAGGVMMLPIPRTGVLQEVVGREEAAAVPGIEDVAILLRPGQAVVPLPEGTRYLGFLFARADTPALAESALREAHRRLDIRIAPAAKAAAAP